MRKHDSKESKYICTNWFVTSGSGKVWCMPAGSEPRLGRCDLMSRASCLHFINTFEISGIEPSLVCWGVTGPEWVMGSKVGSLSAYFHPQSPSATAKEQYKQSKDAHTKGNMFLQWP